MYGNTGICTWCVCDSILYRMKRAEEHRQEKKQYEKSAEQAKKDEE